MFVIQLKNKGDKILVIKYNNNTKNWQRSKINLKNCDNLNTRIILKGSHNSEAAKEKRSRNQQNKHSALTSTGQKMQGLTSRKNVTPKSKDCSSRYSDLLTKAQSGVQHTHQPFDHHE